MHALVFCVFILFAFEYSHSWVLITSVNFFTSFLSLRVHEGACMWQSKSTPGVPLQVPSLLHMRQGLSLAWALLARLGWMASKL